MSKTAPVLLLIALAAAACGTATPAATTAATPALQTKKVDAATAGSVTGKVTLNGPAPAPEMLRVAVDETCISAMGTSAKSDAILVGADGAIQNALVYIKDTLSDYSFDVPTAPVVLDQKGCRYSPRVFGVRVGQPLEMVNSDATMHNVHSMPMVNQEFNRGTPKQNDRFTQIFTAPEQMVLFKCDLHAWMRAYGGVMPHPFFQVTGADGAFAINGIPPGKYELAVWTEKLGSTSQTIELGNSQSLTLNFTFNGKK